MLTPEAKALLGRTVRELRARLLRDVREAAEGAYRLSVKPAERAALGEAALARRRRLEALIDERARATRPKGAAGLEAARQRLWRAAEQEAAATLLNRLVLLRHMEALGLSKPAVVTGGWSSPGYRAFRDFAPALLGDESEGYLTLLRLVFDELALDLPGLFGEVGTTALFPIPTAALREVIERLDDSRLASAWRDDTTLGWVYQYWNDPQREALDAKIAAGGKIEPHEIAAKTQMFTERYMVEWLLHNSLGLQWLCLCRRHGWRADAEAVLPALDARRAAWRARREAGEVALDALMPIEPGLEERWKYYVPQPIPDDAVAQAPDSVRDLRILDPAAGSGHFLVIAFDLLAALYEEEARHRGETWSRCAIAERIVEHNLHGIDIDPRAIQIAAAALFLKVRAYAPDARPRHLQLVAPALDLGALPAGDPPLAELTRDVHAETGIPAALTTRIVTALAGVDHLGSLLKVDAAVDEAVRAADRSPAGVPVQDDWVRGAPPQQLKLGAAEARATVLDRLERFLARHAGADDLGLRLDGEQLAAGVRFMRIAREGTYDLVIGNPPYQGTEKMADAKYVADHYPRGKADLYAAFLERSLELARAGGISALVTMRGWMFLVTKFGTLREHLLKEYDLRSIGDFDRGAFDEVPNEVLAVAMAILRNAAPVSEQSVALQPTPLTDKSYDRERTKRKRAAVLAQVGRFEFNTRGFEAIEGEPIVYWWDAGTLSAYVAAVKLGDVSPARNGMSSQDNTRFLRKVWEVDHRRHSIWIDPDRPGVGIGDWAPYVKGAAGRSWFEPFSDIVAWTNFGLAAKSFTQHLYGSHSRTIKNEALYFRIGIAFSVIGSQFAARAHRVPSVFGHMGASVFPEKEEIPELLCLMNSRAARFILESLNPGLHFLAGDVNRLAIFPVGSADEIYATLDRAFSEHEAARETSVEFKRPGRSAWTYAQAWAQRAVDRPAGEPLSPYEPEYEAAAPEAFVSFAVGVALGRFGPNREGVLDAAPPTALPAGILFLSAASERDSLAHPACAVLHEAWKEHGAAVGEGDDLRTWLRKDFFAHHKRTYENRPIWWPLSSAKKSFVAWIAIHRWDEQTLPTLLADHLAEERRALDGELEDLKQVRAGDDRGAAGKAEKRYAEVQKLLAELVAMIDAVKSIAEQGPPPAGDGCPVREVDARFAMDLDDGVMVNSAALWPLLEPQWKEPKKWWRELARAEGRKDYDWSHLAGRYFPERVERKCAADPSLAVAHGCFWRLHPEKAYAWELRLQAEIGPDFLIDEPDAAACRAAFLAAHPRRAGEIEAAERKRRERAAQRRGEDDAQAPLDFDPDGDDAEEAVG